jgi:hypothetical protein
VSVDLNQGFLFFFRSFRSVEPFGFRAFFSLEFSELCFSICGLEGAFVCELVVLITSLYAWIF